MLRNFALPLLSLALASGGVFAGAGHPSRNAKSSHDNQNAVTKVGRAIEIGAGDIFYSKDSLTVKPGEIIRFVVDNTGKLEHEFVIGSAEEQAEHHKMMLDATASDDSMNHPAMSGGEETGMHGGESSSNSDHGNVASTGPETQGMADADSEGGYGGSMRFLGSLPTPKDIPSLTLQPGEHGELIVRFPEGNANLEFACNTPGHYEAGMRGDIKL